MSDSKINFTEWITPIFPKILQALKMYTKWKWKGVTEICQTLRETFIENGPMSDQEKLIHHHLIEVKIYEVMSCAGSTQNV